MKNHKKRAIDYRALKKMLNPYVTFSFKTPRSGKDFLPQQKSSLTRQYKKLKVVIDNLDEFTFIKYKKGSNKFKGVDGIRTNKGIFIYEKKIKIKKSKITNKWITEYKIGGYKFVDFYFPQEILKNIFAIEEWVNYLISKYKDIHSIMWLRYGTRNGTDYDPSVFNKYFTTDIIDLNKKEDANNTKIGSIIGVSLVFIVWEKVKR